MASARMFFSVLFFKAWRERCWQGCCAPNHDMITPYSHTAVPMTKNGKNCAASFWSHNIRVTLYSYSVGVFQWKQQTRIAHGTFFHVCKDKKNWLADQNWEGLDTPTTFYMAWWQRNLLWVRNVWHSSKLCLSVLLFSCADLCGGKLVFLVICAGYTGWARNTTDSLFQKCVYSTFSRKMICSWTRKRHQEGNWSKWPLCDLAVFQFLLPGTFDFQVQITWVPWNYFCSSAGVSFKITSAGWTLFVHLVHHFECHTKRKLSKMVRRSWLTWNQRWLTVWVVSTCSLPCALCWCPSDWLTVKRTVLWEQKTISAIRLLLAVLGHTSLNLFTQ